MAVVKWTIVQHSAYGYKRNPQFEAAVETRMLDNAGQISRVKRCGGILFDSYRDAEDFAEKANYPDDNPSIIPEAKGRFSKVVFIDDLALYIPVRNNEAIG